jgi:putative transposase
MTCAYGVCKLFHAVKRDGMYVDRDQVGRLMKITGIHGVRRGKNAVTTQRNDDNPRHPDLIKRVWNSAEIYS